LFLNERDGYGCVQGRVQLLTATAATHHLTHATLQKKNQLILRQIVRHQ
jgi:hypothetical protein